MASHVPLRCRHADGVELSRHGSILRMGVGPLPRRATRKVYPMPARSSTLAFAAAWTTWRRTPDPIQEDPSLTACASEGSLYHAAVVQRIRMGTESGVWRTQSRSSWVNRSRRSTVGRTGRVRGFGGLDPGTYLRWRKNVHAHERASSSVEGAPHTASSLDQRGTAHAGQVVRHRRFGRSGPWAIGWNQGRI
jgi:hypothetical protein